MQGIQYLKYILPGTATHKRRSFRGNHKLYILEHYITLSLSARFDILKTTSSKTLFFFFIHTNKISRWSYRLELQVYSILGFWYRTFRLCANIWRYSCGKTEAKQKQVVKMEDTKRWLSQMEKLLTWNVKQHNYYHTVIEVETKVPLIWHTNGIDASPFNVRQGSVG